MAVGDCAERGWPYPPGSYTEELEGNRHKIVTGAATDEYVNQLAEALVVDPVDLDLRQRYAEALARNGDNAKALEQWREITRREPGNRYARSSAANCLRRLGRASEAVDVYRIVLSIPARNRVEHALTLWGLAEALRAAKRSDEALTELERAVTLLSRWRSGSSQLLRQLTELSAAWRGEAEE